MTAPDQKLPCSIAGVSRRRFVQSSVVMGAPFCLPTSMAAATATAATPSTTKATTLEGYASAVSVKQGGSIDFKARDPISGALMGKAYPIAFTRLGSPDKTMSLKGTAYLFNASVPSDASSKGCKWPTAYTLKVPTSWPSGVYWATIGTGATACTIPFIVRAATRLATTKVLVQVPVNTVHAYNNYGGKSLYDYNSTGGRATQVSFNRPFPDSKNISFDNWTAVLVRWLESKGIVADYCSNVELHADAAVLSGYQLFITAGHDEYWSLPMRKNFDAFVSAGGNAAVLSGNTCWWQVRFDSTNRTMTCYKSATSDPSEVAATKTVNWHDLVPPNPGNSSIGLGFLLGGSWVSAGNRPQHPFVLKQPEHWAFAGTNLQRDASFCGAYVGYETDAADFRTGADGGFYPTGLDGAPSTLRILAQADASAWNAESQAMGLSGERSGYSTIAVFSRGGKAGTVFNAGATDWVYGLQPELAGQTPTPISAITLNVVKKLSAVWSESAEVRRFKTNPASGASGYFYTTGTEVPPGMTLDGAAFNALAAPATDSTPVYRFYGPSSGPSNGRRYHYSTDPSVLPSFGWVPDGIAFHAYAADGPGRRAVYQFRTADADGNTVLFFSTNINGLPGWTSDSPAFFVPVA